MESVHLYALRLWLAVTDRARGDDRERGDVPGWVMITILSAVLVVGLIAIAGPKLNDMFNHATDNVSNSGAK